MAQSHNDAHDAAHDGQPALSRRKLLILGGVAIAAGALPLTFTHLEPNHDALAAALMSLLDDPESAARLGQNLRGHSAVAREPGVIAASIGKRLKQHGWHDQGTPEDLRKALVARIERDYATNDMVDISGWQMARTAAELCALAASQTPDGAHAAAAEG
jgi:hypothetical protein